jgi:hypothetical protein
MHLLGGPGHHRIRDLLQPSLFFKVWTGNKRDKRPKQSTPCSISFRGFHIDVLKILRIKSRKRKINEPDGPIGAHDDVPQIKIVMAENHWVRIIIIRGLGMSTVRKRLPLGDKQYSFEEGRQTSTIHKRTCFAIPEYYALAESRRFAERTRSIWVWVAELPKLADISSEDESHAQFCPPWKGFPTLSELCSFYVLHYKDWRKIVVYNAANPRNRDCCLGTNKFQHGRLVRVEHAFYHRVAADFDNISCSGIL